MSDCDRVCATAGLRCRRTRPCWRRRGQDRVVQRRAVHPVTDSHRKVSQLSIHVHRSRLWNALTVPRPSPHKFSFSDRWPLVFPFLFLISHFRSSTKFVNVVGGTRLVPLHCTRPVRMSRKKRTDHFQLPDVPVPVRALFFCWLKRLWKGLRRFLKLRFRLQLRFQNIFDSYQFLGNPTPGIIHPNCTVWSHVVCCWEYSLKCDSNSNSNSNSSQIGHPVSVAR